MKKVLLSAITIVVSIATFAQKPLEKTLLWQILGPGITAPSYLFGTIHLMCKDDIVVSSELRAKFYSTKQLFLELDMDDPSVVLKTMQQMKMKNDTTLSQLLTAAQYDSVAAYFKKVTGMPLDMMKSMKPQLLETVIYPGMLGCEGAEAWEQKFMQLAKANNMNVYGLEQVEDQLKIFDEIPYRVQAEQLAETIEHIDSAKKSFDIMLQMYKDKNLEGLSKMMNDEEQLAAYSDLLLKNRNKKWIPQIIEQAKSIPTFFAVGAAHLGGSYGVISLLKQNGYILTPVMY